MIMFLNNDRYEIFCLVFRAHHRRLLILVGSTKPCPRVYTLPNCPNCTLLKGWLREQRLEFEERVFDTEVQLEFIMMNMFGNPPILEAGSRAIPSEELFVDGVLDEEKVREVLRSEEA